jgi:hypothetical protein
MTNARDLTNHLAVLLRNERDAMADFILALTRFDETKRWRDLGYTSLFYFLHRELGLSKGAAHYRKTAAELAQQLPEILEPLRDGRLCLTSIVELARVVTRENCAEVLPRFFHRSKQEAKEVAAEIRPQEAPPRRAVVTVPQPTQRSEQLPATVELLATTSSPASVLSPASLTPKSGWLENLRHASSRPAPQKSSPNVEPLTGDLRRLHLTISKTFLEKLAAARDALSHAKPGASMEEILEAGLDLVLAAQAKRNGFAEKPLAKPRPSKQGRFIPAHVRREVWKRDQGKCQFRLDSGEVCGSTHRLEVDHLDPVAHGGVATVNRCRLVCDAHNKLAARRLFGDALMDRYTRQARKPDVVREPVAPYGRSTNSHATSHAFSG